MGQNRVPVVAEIDPFKDLSINKSNKTTSNFDPVVTLKDLNGSVITAGKYSDLKASYMLNNPYMDLTQSNKTTNTNKEVIK